MIKIDPKQIPDEVVEAAAKVIYAALEGPFSNQDFKRQQRLWSQARDIARATIVDAINSWNLSFKSEYIDKKGVHYRTAVLPIGRVFPF